MLSSPICQSCNISTPGSFLQRMRLAALKIEDFKALESEPLIVYDVATIIL